MSLAELIDSHSHLGFSDFGADREAVIERARAAGVAEIVCVGAGHDLTSAEEALALARSRPFVHAVVGIHPHDAARAPAGALERIEALCAEEEVVGVGETGLDFHYHHSPRDVQERLFREFVALARRVKLPLVVHVREAHDRALAVLREEHAADVGGVIHCFTGGPAEAKAYADLGFHLSFSGIITFRNAVEVRAACAWAPSERVLVETDAPYLAPLPHRGKRNEPAWVTDVARTVALQQRLSYEDVARITTRNARRLFGIVDPEARRKRLAYPIRDSLYLNLTNRCTLACRFCGKFVDFTVRGHYLKLGRDPDLGDLRDAIAAAGPERYAEIVFCGYGEPTLRLGVLLTLARELKAHGATLRINTDGLANLVYGRDVTPDFAGLIDRLSVSLNAPDAETYARHCPSRYGAAAWPAVKEFILLAKRHVPDVTATAVALPDLDLEACRRVAEVELGVKFRAREYNRMG
ncbi:MAG: YchF/TatD family DNA exonuclease [Deltaproteobacteria bacterium]|nr:YchF/TatD family DNA exonuclease [Deltaproteobacteria bacterium]